MLILLRFTQTQPYIDLELEFFCVSCTLISLSLSVTGEETKDKERTKKMLYSKLIDLGLECLSLCVAPSTRVRMPPSPVVIPLTRVWGQIDARQGGSANPGGGKTLTRPLQGKPPSTNKAAPYPPWLKPLAQAIGSSNRFGSGLCGSVR